MAENTGPILTTEFDVKSNVEELRQKLAEQRGIINDNNVQIAADIRKSLSAQAADQKAYFRQQIADIRVNSAEQRAIIAQTQEELRRAIQQAPRKPLDVNVVSTVSTEAFKLIREELGALLGPLNGVTGRLTAMASLFGTLSAAIKESSQHSSDAVKAFHTVVQVAQGGIQKFTESHGQLWKAIATTTGNLASSSSGFISWGTILDRLTGKHKDLAKATVGTGKEAFTFGAAATNSATAVGNLIGTAERGIKSLLGMGQATSGARKEAFEFGVGTAKAASEIATLETAVQGGGSAMAALGVLARTALLPFVAIATAVATVSAVLFKSGLDIAQTAEKFQNMGARIGQTATQVQGLSLVAASAGVPLEEMVQGLTRLSNALTGHAGPGQAGGGGDGIEDGANRVQRSLKILIGSVRDSQGNFLNQVEVMKKVADQFQKLPDGPVKTALAMEIFGREGAKLIPVLNGGAKAIEEYIKTATDLGPNLEGQAEKMRAWNEATEKVGLAWLKLKGILAESGVFAIVTRFLDGLTLSLEKLGHNLGSLQRAFGSGDWIKGQSQDLAKSITEGMQVGALKGTQALTDEGKKAVDEMARYVKEQTVRGDTDILSSGLDKSLLPPEAADRIKTELDEIIAKANTLGQFEDREKFVKEQLILLAQKDATYGDLKIKQASELARIEADTKETSARAEEAVQGAKDFDAYIKKVQEFHKELDKSDAKFKALGVAEAAAFKPKTVAELTTEMSLLVKKIDDATAAAYAFNESINSSSKEQRQAEKEREAQSEKDMAQVKLDAEQVIKQHEKDLELQKQLTAEKKRLNEEFKAESDKILEGQSKQLGAADRLAIAQDRIKTLNNTIAETLKSFITIPAQRPYDAATVAAKNLQRATKAARDELAKAPTKDPLSGFAPKPLLQPLFADQSGINAGPKPVSSIFQSSPQGASSTVVPALPARKGDTPEIIAKKVEAMNAYTLAMKVADDQQAKLVAEDKRFDDETERRNAAIAALDQEINLGAGSDEALGLAAQKKAQLEDENVKAIEAHKKAQDDIRLIIYRSTQDFMALNEALAANVRLNKADLEALKGLKGDISTKQTLFSDQASAEAAKRAEDALKKKTTTDEESATAKLAGENAKLDFELQHVNDKLGTLAQRHKEAADAVRKDTDELDRFQAALAAVNVDPTAGEKTKQTAQQNVINAKKKLVSDDQKLIEIEKEQQKQVLKLSDAYAALNDILGGFGVRTPKVIQDIEKMIQGMAQLYKLIQFINATKGINVGVSGQAGSLNFSGGAKGLLQSIFGGKQNLGGTGPAGSLGGGVDANGISQGQAPFPITGQGAFGGIGNTPGPSPSLFSGAGAEAAAGPALGGAALGAGIGGAIGGTTGAVGGGLLGGAAGLAGAVGLGAVSATAATIAIPIVGAIVGAAMLVVGILHSRALAETKKTADRIKAQFDQTITSFNNANVTLGASLSQAEAQRNAAFTRLGGQTGGWDQLTTLIPQLDAQIAQLKKQQQDIFKAFDQDLGNLRFPVGVRDTIGSITDLNTKIRDFINAGGDASTAAEYLARSLAQIKTDSQTNLINTEQGVVGLMLQQLDIQRQIADVTRSSALTEYNILNQGVISRTRSVAQNQASQILENRRQRDLQLTDLNQQLDTTTAQIGDQQTLFNLTSDRTALMATQVNLQTQLTQQTQAQVESQIQLNGILAGIKPGGTQVDLNKILSQLGGAVSIPGLAPPTGQGGGVFDPTDFLNKASSEQYGQKLLKQVTGQLIPATLTQAQEQQVIAASQAFPNQTVNVQAFTKALQDIFTGQQLLLTQTQIPGGASAPLTAATAAAPAAQFQTSITAGGTTAATAMQNGIITGAQTAAVTIANAMNGVTTPTGKPPVAPVASVALAPASIQSIQAIANSASKTVPLNPATTPAAAPASVYTAPIGTQTVSTANVNTLLPPPIDPQSFAAPFLPLIKASQSFVNIGSAGLASTAAASTVAPGNHLARVLSGLLPSATVPNLPPSPHNVNVGGVNVHINGTTNMDGPAMQKAVTAGLNQAFNSLRARRGAATPTTI
jgi:hypothetical protein